MPGRLLARPGTAAHVVMLAGSLTLTSRTVQLAAWSARRCAERGAQVSTFHGRDLEFQFYRTDRKRRDERVRRYLAALKAADGVVVFSPAYHGTVSGLLKNALDYVNDLDGSVEPYLSDRPMGCVAVAGGDQGANSTLATLRTVAHALRAWPTPLGLALSGERTAVDDDGAPASTRTRDDLEILLDQVLRAAWRHAATTRPHNGTHPSRTGALSQ